MSRSKSSSRRERDYEAAIQAASDAREAAADPLFAGMSPDEAWDKANLDADEAELDPPASAGSLTAGALLLLAGAGAGAAGILLHPMAFLAAGVFLVGGGLLLLRGIRLRQRGAAILARREELLTWYHVDDPRDILSLAREYRSGWGAAQEAEQARVAAEQAQIDLMNERDRLRQQVFPLVQGFAPTARDTFTLSAAISKALFSSRKNWNRRPSGGRGQACHRLPQPQEIPTADPDLTPRYDGTYTAVRL